MKSWKNGVVIGLMFLVVISSGCTAKKTSPLVDCSILKESFDTYVEKSYLPFFNNSDSLCYGLYVSSNFSELTPKWAVGELLVIRESKFTFEGISRNATIPMELTNIEASQYKIGRDYKIDMNNICRNFFRMADSRYSSPISSTFVKPEEVECNL
jgi:hypothetical protein